MTEAARIVELLGGHLWKRKPKFLPEVYLKIAQFFELVGSVAAFAIFTTGFIMELITLLWRKHHGSDRERQGSSSKNSEQI
jgi:hypothetical protein